MSDNEPVTQPDPGKGGPRKPPQTRIGSGDESGSDKRNFRAWAEIHSARAMLIAGGHMRGFDRLVRDKHNWIASMLEAWERIAREQRYEGHEADLDEIVRLRRILAKFE